MFARLLHLLCHESPLEAALRDNDLRLTADLMRLHRPGLQASYYSDGAAERVWTPDGEFELFLDRNQLKAKVMWPHCQQTFDGVMAEDFSSWDDSSQPWCVAFSTWLAAWLTNMEEGGGHIRPGRTLG